jgi:hypothetical protein
VCTICFILVPIAMQTNTLVRLALGSQLLIVKEEWGLELLWAMWELKSMLGEQETKLTYKAHMEGTAHTQRWVSLRALKGWPVIGATPSHPSTGQLCSCRVQKKNAFTLSTRPHTSPYIFLTPFLRSPVTQLRFLPAPSLQLRLAPHLLAGIVRSLGAYLSPCVV